MSSTLVSHSGCLGPHEFTLVSHLSLTLVSHSGCLGPHDFTLVSHLSLPLVSHTCLSLWVSCSQTRCPWADMCLHSCRPQGTQSGLSLLWDTRGRHSCLPLMRAQDTHEWQTSVGDKCPTLDSQCGRQVWADMSGRQVSHTHALPQDIQSGRHVWETSGRDKWETSVKSCGRRHPECICLPLLGPHDFTLVSHLSLTLGCLGPHEFTLVFHLAPTLVFQSGCLGSHDFQTCLPLVSHTCLSHLSPTLVSHSGCLGPHEFTLVFHLSPTLVSHSGCLGPHDFTLVSHLFPKQVYLYGVLTPFKGLHPWAA